MIRYLKNWKTWAVVTGVLILAVIGLEQVTRVDMKLLQLESPQLILDRHKEDLRWIPNKKW